MHIWVVNNKNHRFGIKTDYSLKKFLKNQGVIVLNDEFLKNNSFTVQGIFVERLPLVDGRRI